MPLQCVPSAWHDLVSLNEVVKGGTGDVQDLGNGGLRDFLAGMSCSVPASPSLVRSEIRSRSTSANNPNRAIITVASKKRRNTVC